MKSMLRFVVIFNIVIFASSALIAQGFPVTFSATGDVPYGSSEIPVFQQQIRDHNLYSPSRFLIHIGDFKSGSSSCGESVYQDVANMLKELAVPVYIVPGDNEWNDCSSPSQAWQYWTRYFSYFEDNFCGTFPTEHQAVRPENMAFVVDGVLFIGINLVGGRVQSQSEWNTRMQQDADWVDFQFQDKMDQVRAAVVFAQAGPGNSNRDLFFNQFTTSAGNFAKPVLFVHGDIHTWRYDKPFSQQNITRLRVNKGGDEDPVQITVNMNATDPWQYVRNPWSNNPQEYNTEPCIVAGADTTVTFPGSALLHARAKDDGVPSNPGVLSLNWSKLSGPGTVTFTDNSSANTSASFTSPGSYVLRLTGNDSQLESFDEITVTVTGQESYLTVNDVQVVEGNSGFANAIFTISINPPTDKTVTVEYATFDSTATAPADYSASGTQLLTFQPNESQKSISVAINGDSVDEPDEYFTVQLSNAVNANIGDGHGIGTILNDDSPPLADFTGNPVSGAAPLAVNFSDQSSGIITGYYWDFGDGTTSSLQNPSHVYNSPGNYTVSLTATGPAGTNTKTRANYISVSNQLTVSFQDGVNGYTGTRDASLFYNSPTRNYGDVSPLETDGSPDKSILLYWDLSDIPAGSIIEQVSITFNVTNGTSHTYEFYELKRPWVESEATWNEYASGQNWATGGADGAGDRGTTVLGTLKSSSGSKTLALNQAGVAVVNSWVDNPTLNNGFIIMDYTNATNGIDLSSREASNASKHPKITITYTPGGSIPPAVAVSDAQVTEGNNGTVNAVFTVTLNPASSEIVTVDYQTADSGAIAPDDYIATGLQTLTFQPNVTEQTITVAVNGDVIEEPDETFFLNLSNAVNATISDGQAVGTIINDDSPPVADFAGNPTSGPAPLSVNFTDQSSGIITGYNWDFGDGTGSTEQNPVHVYTTPGLYTVNLTVTGPAGSDASILTDYITVSSAATVSFQDGTNGYTGTRDASLMYKSPSRNYGRVSPLEADGKPDKSVLLSWDLSSIPAGSIIEQVEITLNATNGTHHTYELYEMKRMWVENEASWNEYAAGQSWEKAGADGVSDRGNTVLGVLSSSIGTATVNLTPEGLAVVQSWVNDSALNHGFIILDYTNATNGIDFSSRESKTVSNRPRITITYSIPSALTSLNDVAADSIDLTKETNVQPDSDPAEELIPTRFALSPNYPNPFNPETRIRFALPATAHVSIVIFDIRGRKVRSLLDAVQNEGFRTVRWDGRDDFGRQVSSGTYLYYLKANNKVLTGKMIMSK